MVFDETFIKPNKDNSRATLEAAPDTKRGRSGMCALKSVIETKQN